MSETVGTEQATTLGDAGTRTEESGSGLNDRIAALISDLEDDDQAIRGAAKASFDRNKEALFTAFNELTSWCMEKGADLNLGQTKLTGTDEESGEGFHAAQGFLNRSANT